MLIILSHKIRSLHGMLSAASPSTIIPWNRTGFLNPRSGGGPSNSVLMDLGLQCGKSIEQAQYKTGIYYHSSKSDHLIKNIWHYLGQNPNSLQEMGAFVGLYDQSGYRLVGYGSTLPQPFGYGRTVSLPPPLAMKTSGQINSSVNKI